MIKMTRKEAEENLAEDEISSMTEDEIIDSLKRLYMYGYEDMVPYCDMTDDEIIDEYTDRFDEMLKLI
jgi:hypothetical protein